MRGGVGPVEPAAVEGQAVGRERVIGHRLQGAGLRPARVEAVQGGDARGLGLVQRAGPEAPARVALAVVEAQRRRIVQRGRHQGERPAPFACPVDAVPQRDDQAAAAGRCDAARLLRHGPALHGGGRPDGAARAQQGLAGDVDPVEGLFVGMPERRFAELAGAVVEGRPHAGYCGLPCGRTRRQKKARWRKRWRAEHPKETLAKTLW